jgi:hypothetical protein
MFGNSALTRDTIEVPKFSEDKLNIIQGKETGFLSEDDISLINSELHNKERKKSIALVMHHHPIEVGTPLIDNYILENRKQIS